MLCAAISRPCGALASARRPIAPRRTRVHAVPAHHVAQLITQLSEAGDVDAPPYIIFVAAALITIVGGAIIPLALKPGQEAADNMQDRDSTKWKG